MKTKRVARPFELKALSETGTFSGYGSVFGVVDSYGDSVQPGAFSASLAAWKAKGKAPALLWQHDAAKPIGCWKSLAEDGHGLLCEGQLALRTQQGAEAYELLKMGAISGLSIGYSIPRGGAEWDPKTEVFQLKQVDLWETSLVTFPANPDAQVEDVKSAGDHHELKRTIEAYLRDAGRSRTEAKAGAAAAFKALGLRDADDELAQLARDITNLTQTIRGT